MYQDNPFILLVDDNEADTTLTEIVLKGILSKVRVESFNSGPQVIDFLKQLVLKDDFPDMMFIDMNMPEMNAPEVISVLVEHGLNKFPIYIFSGMDILPTEQFESVDGIHAYLQKPPDYNSMIDLFEKLLIAPEV